MCYEQKGTSQISQPLRAPTLRVLLRSRHRSGLVQRTWKIGSGYNWTSARALGQFTASLTSQHRRMRFCISSDVVPAE